MSIKWNGGDPPHIGWWCCLFFNEEHSVWRWWNGNQWSLPVSSLRSEESAKRLAQCVAEELPDAEKIQWCDFWPENARVARVSPSPGEEADNSDGLIDDLVTQLEIARIRLLEIRESIYDSCKNLTTGVVHDPEDIEYLEAEDQRIASIDKAIENGKKAMNNKAGV